MTRKYKIVYVAGALSSKEQNNRTPSQVVVDYLSNVQEMCRLASIVRKDGFIPYVPALDCLMGMVNGDWIEEDYRGMGMGFLEVSDVLLVTSESWGVEKEIQRAKELDIPVVYGFSELRKWREK